jgi:hypothetical protein
MLEVPPGGAWIPVVGLSVRKLPQFWFEPLAKAFDETLPCFGVPAWAVLPGEDFSGGDGLSEGEAGLGTSPASIPNWMLERPPGGASTPVLGRSVNTLPQFWFEPLAKAFDDTVPLGVPELPLTVATLGGIEEAPVDVGDTGFATSATSPPKQMLVRPPGGARTPVLGRSVNTLPQFWL